MFIELIIQPARTGISDDDQLLRLAQLSKLLSIRRIYRETTQRYGFLLSFAVFLDDGVHSREMSDFRNSFSAIKR